MPFDFYVIRRRMGEDGHERREFLVGPHKYIFEAIRDLPLAYSIDVANGVWDYSTYRLPRSKDNPRGKLNGQLLPSWERQGA